MIAYEEALDIGGNMLLDAEWLTTSAVQVTHDDEAWYFTSIRGPRGSKDFVVRNGRTARVMKETGEADWFDPYGFENYLDKGYKDRIKLYTLIE